MTSVSSTDTSALLRRPDRLYDGYVFDLDGTVYLGDALLPGAADAIAAAPRPGQADGLPVQQPHPRPADVRRQAGRAGHPTPLADIVNPVVTVPRWLQATTPTRGSSPSARSR